MKVIKGHEIKYKETFGIFNKPFLLDYIRNHEDLLSEKDKIYIKFGLEFDKNVYIPYSYLVDVERLALENHIKVKTVYYCDNRIYISCC